MEYAQSPHLHSPAQNSGVVILLWWERNMEEANICENSPVFTLV